MANIFKKAAKGVRKAAGSIKKNAVSIAMPVLALDKVGIGPTKGLEKTAGKYGVNVNSLTGGQSIEGMFTNVINPEKAKPKAQPTAQVPANASAEALQADTKSPVTISVVLVVAAIAGIYWFMRGRKG